MTRFLQRITIITLLLALFCTLIGCGSSSGITIEQLGNKLSSGSWSFSESENEDGTTFDYTQNSVVSIKYSGQADSKGNVVSVSITNENVDTSILLDSSKLTKTVSKSSGDMNMNDIKAGYCATQFWSLKEIFGEDESEKNSSEAISEACDFFNGNSVEVNGWKIIASVNSSSKTVTITATYEK